MAQKDVIVKKQMQGNLHYKIYCLRSLIFGTTYK